MRYQQNIIAHDESRLENLEHQTRSRENAIQRLLLTKKQLEHGPPSVNRPRTNTANGKPKPLLFTQSGPEAADVGGVNYFVLYERLHDELEAFSAEHDVFVAESRKMVNDLVGKLEAIIRSKQPDCEVG